METARFGPCLTRAAILSDRRGGTFGRRAKPDLPRPAEISMIRSAIT
jgi:hypothetical protein